MNISAALIEVDGGSAEVPLSSRLLPSWLQNAIVSFKELCGLAAVANLKQCILALCPRLIGPDNSPLLVFNLAEQYPYLEPQGLLPDLLKKVVTTYDLVSIPPPTAETTERTNREL